MIAAYDAIADWYDESVRKGSLLADTVASHCFEILGDVTGQHICDLACGQGNLSRQLARRGAEVVGIDLSIKLLQIARREELIEPLGIQYLQGDAQDLSDIDERQFDGVLCNCALMDIPDLKPVAASIARVLRPRGWFLATITHPCFQSPPGRGYLEEGFWRSDNPNGVRGQVGAYHRSVGTYITEFGEAGLSVVSAKEPPLRGLDAPPVLFLKCKLTQ